MLSTLAATFAGGFELAIAVSPDLAFTPSELVGGADVADGAVEAVVVVVVDVGIDDALGLRAILGPVYANGVAFERFVPTLELTVGLWITG